ncbi:MAG: FAD-dependent oxidoreductase, partial [Arenimonas sp.]|uniref:NAD(P)/FAD-dependent oxidoreductase n=1 Tax=Arenimonas sp. TaxID=1872635 RepID=UPI0025BACBB0
MAHIVILGAGIGGMSAAYEIRASLPKQHRITVVGEGPQFSFTPSNPWVAVGWRESTAIQINVQPHLAKKDIQFEGAGARTVVPEENHLVLGDGRRLDYDYLVITTGPRLAFDEVPGLGPQGHTHSVCTTAHASEAWAA